MAKMEHARWKAERLLGGWVYDPERNNGRKRHPNLVEWDQLSEEIKNLDRQAMAKIPAVLKQAGLVIFPGSESRQ